MASMNYRDDREALHHRIGQLENELQDARREGEEHGRDEAQTRAVALEQRLADMRGELEKMGAELNALRGDKPRRAANVPLIAGAMVVVLFVLGGLGFVTTRRSRPPVPIATAVAPLPSPVMPVRPVEPVMPVVQAPTLTPPPPPPPRSTTARWNAKISRAEGLALAPGATCTVDATITATDTNALVNDLVIQCGAQSLYRSRDRFSGMSQSHNDAREVFGPTDDKSTFTLQYNDIGSRTGERAQVDLDTTHHQASVFRETIPRFRVELSLPTTSTPGAPLSGPDQRLRRAGKVSHVSGTAPVKEGATCVLRAMANGKGTDCIAEVACATTIVWPASGAVSCTYDGARPVTVATEDGPGLILEDSTLTAKGKSFVVEIALDAP
jgi:hypothetical protein